jgi:hypothetical protein
MTRARSLLGFWLACCLGAVPVALGAQPRTAVVIFEIPSETKEGISLFEHASSAIVTEAGLIAVADDRAQRVRLLDRTARVVNSWGRVGAGPGEFKGLWSLGECKSGHLYAYDRMLQRITILSPNGGPARVHPIAEALTSFTCGSNGTLVLTRMPDVSSSPLGVGGRIVYRGKVELRDEQLQRVAILDNVSLGEPRTLGQFSYFAVSGEQIAIATGDSAWVDLVTRTGKRSGGFRAGVLDRKPTVAQYTHAAEVLSASLVEEAQRRASVRLMLKQPMPDRLPPYSGLVAAGNDGFWVVEGFGGDAKIRVVRYSASLKRLFEVDLPPKSRVLSGTRDYLLAAIADSEGFDKLVGFAPSPSSKK